MKSPKLSLSSSKFSFIRESSSMLELSFCISVINRRTSSFKFENSLTSASSLITSLCGDQVLEEQIHEPVRQGVEENLPLPPGEMRRGERLATLHRVKEAEPGEGRPRFHGNSAPRAAKVAKPHIVRSISITPLSKSLSRTMPVRCPSGRRNTVRSVIFGSKLIRTIPI